MRYCWGDAMTSMKDLKEARLREDTALQSAQLASESLRRQSKDRFEDAVKTCSENRRTPECSKRSRLTNTSISSNSQSTLCEDLFPLNGSFQDVSSIGDLRSCNPRRPRPSSEPPSRYNHVKSWTNSNIRRTLSQRNCEYVVYKPWEKQKEGATRSNHKLMLLVQKGSCGESNDFGSIETLNEIICDIQETEHHRCRHYDVKSVAPVEAKIQEVHEDELECDNNRTDSNSPMPEEVNTTLQDMVRHNEELILTEELEQKTESNIQASETVEGISDQKEDDSSISTDDDGDLPQNTFHCWVDDVTISSVHSEKVEDVDVDLQPETQVVPEANHKAAKDQPKNEQAKLRRKNSKVNTKIQVNFTDQPKQTIDVKQTPENEVIKVEDGAGPIEELRSVECETCEETEPDLPNYICPSSEAKSKHAAIKEWITKSNFLCATRNVPLF